MRVDWPQRANTAGDGLVGDLALYGLSTIFAWLTIGSTLPAHRTWATIATIGYALATFIVTGQLLALRTRGMGVTGAVSADRFRSRVITALGAWAAVCLTPLVYEAMRRADGLTGHAQEEVPVVEHAGIHTMETGTPFLGREAIAALPEPLLGYTPYQPGMATFGFPRALLGTHWLTDARVWFALATALCLYLALSPAWRTTSPTLVRALQAVTVLPVAALTLATGGDDLPVLALTLLGLTYLARGRELASGIALGLAAALKLFAWPVAVVALVAWALTQRGNLSSWARFAGPLFLIPLLTALPALLVDPAAFAENVIGFPLGHGLVVSPAASPLPGHLIATAIPGGRYIALGLLALAACALTWWIFRRPPQGTADAARICAIGLLAAILLMPATRFGYLLYPAAYALWIGFLASTEKASARPRRHTMRVGS